MLKFLTKLRMKSQLIWLVKHQLAIASLARQERLVKDSDIFLFNR